MHFILPFVFAITTAPLWVGTAHAYIGPGAAVAFLGYAFGPVIAIVVSVGLVLAWIARMIWCRVKGVKSNKNINKDTMQD